MYTIYKITNMIDGNRYVGYTILTPPEKRWEQHKRHAKRTIRNTYLYSAMRKYGIENFSFEVLAWGEDHKAGLKIGEPLFIEMFKPEYNLTGGGEGSLMRTISSETREKIGKASRERKHFPLSVEHKLKLSKALSGRVFSTETRRKMSESGKKKVFSTEAKMNMSIAQKRRYL